MQTSVPSGGEKPRKVLQSDYTSCRSWAFLGSGQQELRNGPISHLGLLGVASWREDQTQYITVGLDNEEYVREKSFEEDNLDSLWPEQFLCMQGMAK